MKKKTTKEFILEAKEVHGNKYDYSLVDYVNNNTLVKIICKEHGVFEKKPLKHTCNKQGCPVCSKIKTHDNQRKTTKEFILEAKEIHGDKYDYSLVNYVNNSTPIKIICKEHGVFEQIPYNHLNGKGCKYCGGTAKMDTNLFIIKAKEIHGDKYDYSLVNYVNSATKVKIICKEHGIFEQTPNNHISKGYGCFKCLDKVYNTDSFISKSKLIHGDKYDYSLVNYVNTNDKIKIICPEHGVFEQSPMSHLVSNGCVKCSNNGMSKYEKIIGEYIKSLGVSIIENDTTILNGKELDIYIPSHNLAIEFNGLYWHSEEFVGDDYHLNKTNECESKGIRLIHIFEDEWLYSEEIVKSRIKTILGLIKSKIYARKCEIREVSNKDSKLFLNENHIQKNTKAKINLGLYYNDELVCLSTFSNLRKIMGSKNIDGNYELIRFCNKLNTVVVGGADKLLKHFIKTYKPIKIISYADRRWSQGELYEKLGFKFIHNSKPNYWYINNKDREYRFKYRKSVLIKDGYDKNKTEKEIMFNRGIYRIYDCGNIKYELSLL